MAVYRNRSTERSSDMRKWLPITGESLFHFLWTQHLKKADRIKITHRKSIGRNFFQCFFHVDFISEMIGCRTVYTIAWVQFPVFPQL